MAGGFQPTNTKPGKPVTEKKKRKRPSKKVPTTVLESSSTNFMDLVQKLTGSAAELASSTTKTDEKRPKSDLPSPAVSDTSYFQNYLHNALYNDNDSSSSSQHSTYAPPALPFPPFLAMDPTSGYNFAGEALEDDLYQSGYTAGASNSSSSQNDLALFSSSWRDPTANPDHWYHQMDAMRA